MKGWRVVSGVAVLAGSGISNAEGIGLRVGLESPIYSHADQNGQSLSFSIGDTFQPAIDVLLEYYMNSFVALGLEGREGFLATGNNPTISGCVGRFCRYHPNRTSLSPHLP